MLSISQNIAGTVVAEKNGRPIDNANVSLFNYKTSTMTSKKGEFSLRLPSSFKEKDTIEFSHIGFTTLKISLEDFKKFKFKVSLQEEIENLPELTISSNSHVKLKSKLAFKKLSPLKHGIYAFGSSIKNGSIYVVGGNSSFSSDAFQRAKDKTITENMDTFMKFYYDELRRQEGAVLYTGDFLIYDIKNDNWHTSEMKFKKRAHSNVHFYNNTMYVLGGKRTSANAKFEFLENEIEVLDLTKNEIKIDKTNPHQAINFASFSYKDNIILMGGSTKSNLKGKKQFTDKVHFYNLTSGLWYELSNMPNAKETSGVLIGDKIYLIGGNDGQALSDIEVLNLIDEKWVKEGKLFSPLENPAITSQNNTIYIFEDRKVYTYNIVDKQLKEYNIDLELKSSAMHFFNNKLYIIGGYTYNHYSTNPSSYTYSIDIDEFDATKPNRIKVLSKESNAATSN